MQAGKLRQKWQFQKRGVVENPWLPGEVTEGDFETVFSDFGELIPLRGSETVMASRLAGIQPAILRVRQNGSTRQINEAWRVIDSAGQTWAIKAPPTDPDQKRAWLEILIQSPSIE